MQPAGAIDGWALAGMARLRREYADGVLVALTDRDVYVPGLESVYGQAVPRYAVACASAARLRTPQQLASVAVHEAGHLWGLQHCEAEGCAMRPATRLADVDARGTVLCERCQAARCAPSIAPLPGPASFVYSPMYRMDFGNDHVFPTLKFETLRARVSLDSLDPDWPEDDDLALVHEAEYLDDLAHTRQTPRTAWSECPVSEQVLTAQRWMTGGTMKAAGLALERRGFAMNMGGGFHHAFAAHSEGFCYYNDVAISVRRLQRDGAIKKAAIIDCDVHQGNGTAHIFQGDYSVFTLSMHQENLYPPKQRSDLDISLPDGVDDDAYLARMRRTIPSSLSFFAPDIVYYLAGADPYEHDRLGGLGLSIDGLRLRDELVFEQCFTRGIPCITVLAGGYAEDWHETVAIHHHTITAAQQLYGD